MKIKYPISLKSTAMLDPITCWFEMMQYDVNKVIKIENLVLIVWLTRYTWSSYIT